MVQMLQPKYGSGAWSRSGVDPHHLRWDIDGTGAEDRVNPKLKLKSCNPNMDPENVQLEMCHKMIFWNVTEA